jgi:hypothetical protein
VEYLLLLLGCAISLLLTEYTGLKAVRTDHSPGWMSPALATILPYLLLLPVGLILWWPVFFALGRLRGRPHDLSLVEWIWGCLWLGDLVLVIGIISFHALGANVPALETMREIIGPLLRVLSVVLAGVAIGLVGLGYWLRLPRPWTHHFGLAMLLWPLLSQILLWLGHVQLELEL